MLDYNHPFIKKQQELITNQAQQLQVATLRLQSLEKVIKTFDQLNQVIVKLNHPEVKADWDMLVAKAVLASDADLTINQDELNRHNSYRSEFGNRDAQSTSLATQ